MSKINDIKFKNPRSVSFRTPSFCVPTKRSRPLRHIIYGTKASGIRATTHRLETGFGVGHPEVKPYFNNGESVRLPTFEGKIQRMFCFNTTQNNVPINVMLVFTDRGSYYFALVFQASLVLDFEPHMLWHGEILDMTQSFTVDRERVFMATTEGLFHADFRLEFRKVNAPIKPAKLKVFGHRLFALDALSRDTIHFSAPLDLVDFSMQSDQSGSLRVDNNLGEIIGFETLGDRLLIVQQWGFSILETSYDSAEFRLQTFANSYEEIFENTTKVLGDSVFFLTRGGLCRMNARGQVELLDHVNVDFAPDQGQAVATVYQNRYFLAFNRICDQDNEGNKNNTVLIVEKFLDNYMLLEDFNVSCFERIWTLQSDHLGITSDGGGVILELVQNGKIVDSPVAKVWESDFFNLTYAATVQYVKQILVRTLHPIKVTVIGASNSQSFQLVGSEKLQRININFKSESSKIRIEAVGDVNVSQLNVVVGFNNIFLP